MEFFSCCGKLQSRHGTLVVPALSIGNAGQLAVDLLISSLNASRVGYFDDPCVLPCVGNDPFGPNAEGKLTVALELYAAPQSNLYLLQQRSPLVKGMTITFSQKLAEWAKEQGFDQVVVLSGLDSGRKIMVHDFHGPQVYYVSSASQDGTDPLCEQFGWRRLEFFSLNASSSLGFEFNAMRQALESTHNNIDIDYFASLPAAALVSACKAKGLSVLCLFCYCAEGDNVPDAFFLANALDKLVNSSDGMECKSWRVPLSWSTIYGPPPDDSMY